MVSTKAPAPYDAEKHCGAPNRAGDPCRQEKGWGTDHSGYGNCKLHFGMTPNNRKSAQLEAAKSAARRLGVAVPTNPFDSLMLIEAEARGDVEYFRQLVQTLDPDMVFVRPTSILCRPLDEGKEGENPDVVIEEITEMPVDLHIAVNALREAREELRRISKTSSDTNIAERIVAIQENRARREATALKLFCEDLGIPINDPKTIKAAAHFDIEGTTSD